MDFTSRASKRRERAYFFINSDKFLSLNDLYRLGFASLSEPLSPRSVPLLSLCDIFPVSSGKSTPRGKARKSFLRFIRYIGKVPRILRSAVDTSISLIRMRGVVRSTFPSRKTFALRKHFAGRGRVVRIPPVPHIYGSKSDATKKHVAHIGNACGIPRRKVKRSKIAATVKHTRHIRNACGIPRRNVYIVQFAAIAEHKVHSVNFARIPRRNVKRSKTAATEERSAHFFDFARVPRRNVKRSETAAIIEHTTHIFNFAGVPTRKIKRRQRRTVIKRTFHIGNACGVPV